MSLYHRTCVHSIEAITETGALVPRSHPFLRRPLVWMSDTPDLGRLALGLTSNILRCDRMAFLVTVEDPVRAMLWTEYARRSGIDATRLQTTGAKPSHWWVSEHKQSAVILRDSAA